MKQTHKIKRRVSQQIFVGNVAVGGDAPISVQSMTNTDTCNVESTVSQILSLEKAGADLVRVSIPTMEAAEAFKKIKKRVNVPLITDIHFDYKIALKVAGYGADCLRINPGNIGKEDRIREVVAAAKHNGIPIRIGVNAGSLEKDLQKNILNLLLKRWWSLLLGISIYLINLILITSRSHSRLLKFL